MYAVDKRLWVGVGLISVALIVIASLISSNASLKELENRLDRSRIIKEKIELTRKNRENNPMPSKLSLDNETLEKLLTELEN